MSCQCAKCLPCDLMNPASIRMIICQKCGNKRCPRAEWHGYECTGSNEPNQIPVIDGSKKREPIKVTIHQPIITVEKDIMGTVHIYIQYKEGAEKFDFININYHGLYTNNNHQKRVADGILKLLGVEVS